MLEIVEEVDSSSTWIIRHIFSLPMLKKRNTIRIDAKSGTFAFIGGMSPKRVVHSGAAALPSCFKHCSGARVQVVTDHDANARLFGLCYLGVRGTG